MVARIAFVSRTLELAREAGAGHQGGPLCNILRIVGLPDIAPERLTLYLPHPESRLCTDLAHGSAIVGLALASGRVRIYYEGNVIGAENLKRFRDRAVQAAGRMLSHYPAGYPTRARDDVDAREVVEIGYIEAHTNGIHIVATSAELNWWIEPADLIDLGLIEQPR
jgi:hypothetical protein